MSERPELAAVRQAADRRRTADAEYVRSIVEAAEAMADVPFRFARIAEAAGTTRQTARAVALGLRRK